MLVGTAEISILANDAGFAASLEAGTAPAFAGLADEAAAASEAAGAELRSGLGAGGLAAGSEMRAGVQDGLDGVAADADKAGQDASQALSGTLGAGGMAAGSELSGGVKNGLDDIAADAEKAGADASQALGGAMSVGGAAAGNELRAGVKGGMGDIATDAGKLGDDAGAALGAGFSSKAKGAYQDAAGSWHDSSGKFITEAEATGSGAGGGLRKGIKGGLDGAEDDANKASSGIAGALTGKLGGVMNKLGMVGAAGLLAFGAASVKAGVDYQASTAKIAAAADIPIKTANQIGAAFLQAGADTIYSGKQQEAALAPIAGQLKEVAGGSLNVSKTVGFMKTAMDLAEESGSDLGSTTKDLSQVMQTFQVPLKGAASTATDLFNASRITGTGIDALTSTMDRMKARLGVDAPSVSSLSTLLVDVGEHGVTGSRGLMVVNTALTSLLKPSSDLITAQTALKTATDQLPPSLKSVADEYSKGNITASQLTDALNGGTSATKTQTAAIDEQVAKLKEQQAALKASADGTGDGTTAIQQQIAQLQAQKQALSEQASGTKANTSAITDQIAQLTAQKAAIATQAAAAGGATTAMKTQTAEIDQQILSLKQQAQQATSGAATSKAAITQQSAAIDQQIRALQQQATAAKGGTSATSEQSKAITDQIAKLNAQKSAIVASAAASTSATQGLTISQQAAWKAFTDSATAVDSAKSKLDAMGISTTSASGHVLGLGSIIGELDKQLKGETQSQQLATLSTDLGANASKALLSTVLAGPAAYAKAQKAVTDAAAAHHALVVQQQTLGHAFDSVKTEVVDLATRFGTDFLPVLKDVAKEAGAFLGFLADHKGVLIAIAAVVGGVLVTAMGMWVAGLLSGGAAAAAAIAPTSAFGASAARLSGTLAGLSGNTERQVAAAKIQAKAAGDSAVAADGQSTAMSKLVGVLQELVDKLPSASSETSGLTESLDGVVGSAEKADTATAGLAKNLGGVAPAATEAAAGVNELSDSLVGHSLAPAADTTSAAIDGLQGSLEPLGATASELVPSVESLSTSLESMGPAASELSDSLAGVASSAAEADPSLAGLAASLDGIGPSAEGAAVSLEGLSTTAEALGPIAETSGAEAGIGFDSMLGPIGLLIPVILLLATHWKEVWGVIKTVAGDAWHFLDNDVIHPLTEGFDFVKDHLKEVAPAFLLLLGPIGLLAGAGIEIVSHWKGVVGFFEKIPGEIIGFFEALPKYFEKLPTLLVDYFVKFPEMILSVFADAGSWLLGVGKDIIGGLLKGIEYLSPITWILKYKGQILGALADAPTWLLHVGEDIIGGLIKGIEFLSPVTWILKYKSQILGAVSDAATWLLHAGEDIVTGLIKGVELISPLYWVLKYKSDIVGFFKDAGTWLLDAGKELIAGLIKGAVEAPIKGLEGIGKKVIGGFKSIFHIFSPSKDTEPIGKGLVDGLSKGLSETDVDTSALTKVFNKVLPAFQKLAGDLTKALKSAGGGGTPDFGATAGVDAMTKALTKGETVVAGFGKAIITGIDGPLAKSVAVVMSFAKAITELAGVKNLSTAVNEDEKAVSSLASRLTPAESTMRALGKATETTTKGFTAGATETTKIATALTKAETAGVKLVTSFVSIGQQLKLIGTDITRVIAGFTQLAAEHTLAAGLKADDVALRTFAAGLKPMEPQLLAVGRAVTTMSKGFGDGAKEVGKISTSMRTAEQDGVKLVATLASIGPALKAPDVIVERMANDLAGLWQVMKQVDGEAPRLTTAFKPLGDSASTAANQVKGGAKDWQNLIDELGKADTDARSLSHDLGDVDGRLHDVTKSAVGFDQALVTIGLDTATLASVLDTATTATDNLGSRGATVFDRGVTLYIDRLAAFATSLRQYRSDLEETSTSTDTYSTKLTDLTGLVVDAGNRTEQFAGSMDKLRVEIDQIGTSLSGVNSDLRNFEDTLTSGLEGLDSNLHNIAYNIGGDIGSGLAQGIQANSTNVIRQAQNVAGGALSAMRTLLGIASPSTVMAGVGTNMMEGLALGVTAQQPAVNSTMTDTATTMWTTFEKYALTAQTAAADKLKAGILAATNAGAPSGGTPAQFGALVQQNQGSAPQADSNAAALTANTLQQKVAADKMTALEQTLSGTWLQTSGYLDNINSGEITVADLTRDIMAGNINGQQLSQQQLETLKVLAVTDQSLEVMQEQANAIAAQIPPALAAVPTTAAALIGDALKNQTSTWLSATGTTGAQFVQYAKAAQAAYNTAAQPSSANPAPASTNPAVVQQHMAAQSSLQEAQADINGQVETLTAGMPASWTQLIDQIAAGSQAAATQMRQGLANGSISADGQAGIEELFSALGRKAYAQAALTGNQAVAGLAAGLNQNAESSKAAANAAQALMTQLNQGLGVSSPSTKTHQAGLYLMQGLTEGIRAGTPGALGAMKDTAETLAKTPFAPPEPNLANVASSRTAGEAPAPPSAGGEPIVNLYVQPGAVVVQVQGSVSDDNIEQVKQGVQDGFTRLASEIRAGVNPMRVRMG